MCAEIIRQYFLNLNVFPIQPTSNQAKQTHEKTFTLCGTPLYLAPETLLNQGKYSMNANIETVLNYHFQWS